MKAPLIAVALAALRAPERRLRRGVRRGGARAESAPSDGRTPAPAPAQASCSAPTSRSGRPRTSTSSTAAAAGYGTTRRPGALLHAGNDIRSRGRGPMELRGQRYKRNWMRANQAIYRVGGGVEVFRTEARLHFYSVGYEYGGSYWKVHDPLSMEIWSLDERRRPLARVRKGPKVFYCFRDLERTKAMRRSPPHRVYPACSQDPSRKRVQARHLGRLVGHLPLRLRPPVGQRQPACAAASPS